MTIQYIMLVSLGFLIASLFTLLLAPLFWHRAVRLTNDRLRQSLPLSEQEILAVKDQLRAKYAIRVHQLEKQVEQSSLGGARQKIDLNRRDASISQLETDITRLKSEMEESLNARLVLEQTVGDRIPKIEAKLDEARKLLLVRDREVAELSQTSRRQQEALNEARVINKQQVSDNERLRSQVRAFEAQSRKGKSGGDADGELAILTELEMLRSRTREQVATIERLNSEMAASRSQPLVAPASVSASASAQIVPLNGSLSPLAVAADSQQEAVIAELRREIAALQSQHEQAKTAPSEASKTATASTATERELRAIKAQVEDQTAEIARLRGELAATATEKAADESSVSSLRDNRIALKAQLAGLEAKGEQQAETIQRLRAELAQANERSARQAESFVEEMRRLGVAAHVTQPRTGRATSATSSAGEPHAAARPRNITQRTQAVFDESRTMGLSSLTANDKTPAQAPASSSAPPVANPTPLGRRLVASTRTEAEVAAVTETTAENQNSGSPATKPQPRVSNLVAALRGGQNGTQPSASQSAGDEKAPTDSPPQRQSRLVDRITATDGKG